MFKDNISTKSNVQFFIERDGNKELIYETGNLVVDTGREYIASRFVNDSTPAVSHMAIGLGNTVASGSQTALINELDRKPLSVSTSDANTVTLSATFPADPASVGGVVEAGVFNDATAGTMIARTTFPIVTKESGDSLIVNWTISVI